MSTLWLPRVETGRQHADTARKGWLLLKISPWMDFMWLNHVKSGVVQLQGQGES